MPNFKHIFTVAKIEAKLLRRSITIKLFWLISLLSLVFIVFFPQYGMWDYDTFLPGMQAANCFFFFSIFKIILSSFLSPVFINDDRKKDSFQAFSARPFNNLSYMFGKMFGFTAVMLITDYVFMTALYIYYILNYNYSATPWPYLLYPIIITLPLSIFIFGINAFAARIRYALVFLIPILMVLAFLPLQDVESKRFLDLGALTVPLAYSVVSGFYNLKLIIIQRLIFVFAGIGFVIGAGILMENVRRSLYKEKAIIFGLLIAVCFTASIGCALLDQKPIRDGIVLRDILREHQNTIAGNPHIHIDSCHLDVAHNKSEIDVIAKISVSNPNTASLSRFFINLNPGFKVKEIYPMQRVSGIKRELNTIEITLESPLEPNKNIEFEIAYSGSVDEAATYLHIPESFRERIHRTGFTVIGKQVAFIEPDYVILPAEVNWYPTAVPPSQVSEPGFIQRDLADFSLDISTRESLTPISQGKMTANGTGSFSFSPDMALTQVSLTIGDYKKCAVTADSIEYSYHWLEKGFVGSAEVTEEDVIEAITSNKQRQENLLQLSYPFNRFQIVQTPVHYFGYNSGFELSGAYDQPEVSFITELPFDLDKLMVPVMTDPFTRNYNVNVSSRISGSISRNFCMTQTNSLFIERKINPTSYFFGTIGLKEFSTDPFADYGSIFPQYAVFSKENISKSDFFDLLVVNWLRSKLWYYKGNVQYSRMSNGSLDRAEHQIYSSKSLNEILNEENFHYEILDIFNISSTSFFTFLSMKTDTEITDIESAIFDRLHSPGNDLLDELSNVCGADVLEILNDYSDYISKAHYEISDITVSKHLINNRYQYNARLKISNPTPYPCLVKCGIIAPPDVMRNGAKSIRDSKAVNLEPFSQKEIGLVVPKEITDMYFLWFPFGQKDQKSNKFYGEVVEPDRMEYFDDIRVVESVTVPFGVVIDNLDEGCRIINPGKKSFLVRLIEKRAREKTFKTFTRFPMLEFNMEDAPDVWTLTKSESEESNMNEFYGKYSSCYYTKAGDGNSSIEYSAAIPEAGKYHVYLSYPKLYSSSLALKSLLESGDLGETTVRVFTGDGIREDVCDIRNSDGEWAYVGMYSFADTTAVIHITDKTNAKIVIADAIKLRKAE